LSKKHPMKATMLICAVVSFYCVHGQNPSQPIYINASIGFFRLTTDNANINNTPLMIDGKIGMRVGKKDGVGLQFSSIAQSVPTSGISSLQPGGGGALWTKYGTLRHTAVAAGIFYERFFLLGKRIDFFPSAYVQYLHYTDEESGHIVAGTDSSMTYKSAILHNYIGRLGVNLNLQYEITTSFSITARFAQIDCRVWNKYEQHVFIELPLLLGFKFSFK